MATRPKDPMKLLPATAAGLVFAALSLSSCTTPTLDQTNHWRIESVGPRIVYQFTGYDGMIDGSSSDYAKAQAAHFKVTLQRMLLNVDPNNPLTADH